MLFDPKWEAPAVADIKLEPWQQVLLKAADILEQGRWIQGRSVDEYGGHCAVGAVYAATMRMDMKEIYPFATGMVWAHISKLNSGYNTVQSWNDASKRTKEQVVFALRGAANVV